MEITCSTSTHITGDKLVIFTNDGHKIEVQLTPLTDTETGAIVWRDNTVIGGLWRRENA